MVSDSSQTSSLEPPYPTRTKPAPDPAFQPKNKRKLGETAEFPWNRQIDFEGAKTQVAWRKKDLYEAVTLDKMDEVRKKNADYIDRAKLDESGKQREFRSAGTPVSSH